jgi:hypothetical protein
MLIICMLPFLKKDMHVPCTASVKFYIVCVLLFSLQENELYTYLGNLTSKLIRNVVSVTKT